MRPAAQVQASIELLEKVTETGYPADRIMAQYFRSNRYIGSKDKAAISELLYTILRNRLSLEYVLEQADLPIYPRFLMAAKLRQQGDSIADVFDGQGYNPKPFSKSDVQELQDMDLSVLETAPQHVKFNVPEWLVGKLQASLGELFSTEMLASNEQASTDIRVNTLKSNLEQTQAALRDAGLHASETPLSPIGLTFSRRESLFGLDSFKKGWFEIQDQGSQILALVSQAKAGDKVVDFCAGAGGKTLAMSALMNNKGTLYACDVHSKRLEQLSKRAKRAGAHNIRVHQLSSENDKWVKKHRNTADLLLLDVPCSGTGTWRRSPDSRWNLQPENLANLMVLQQSILQSASRLVKIGGRLLYATCSLLNEENEQQIETFLSNNDDFQRGELVLPDKLKNNLDAVDYQTHQLRLFPGLSNTDGFYVCELVRKVD